MLVPAKVFRAVAANLTDPKTRARFMVIASTGVRPAELKRAEPADVDLERRVWLVRTAKGGAPRAFWLNDDMMAAMEGVHRGRRVGALRRQRLREGAVCGGLAEGCAAVSGAAHAWRWSSASAGSTSATCRAGSVTSTSPRRGSTTRQCWRQRLKQASETLAGRFERLAADRSRRSGAVSVGRGVH